MASRTAYSTWTPQKPTLFDNHYLRNRSTLDIGVLGYIGIVQHKEHSPKVFSVPPGTPCIYIYVCVCVCQLLLFGLPSFSSSTLCAIFFVCFPTYTVSYLQIYPHFSVTWSRDRSLLPRNLALYIITYSSLPLHLRLNINCTVLQSDLWDDTVLFGR